VEGAQPSFADRGGEGRGIRREADDREIRRHHAGFRLSALAVDALGAAGLAFESRGEAAEDDDATTWNIDYIYDVGLMIGGGSNNIQKNIIGERGLGLPREPKAQAASTIAPEVAPAAIAPAGMTTSAMPRAAMNRRKPWISP